MDNMTVIYTGPTRNRLGLKHYQVYDNGLPEYVSAMIEQYPVMSKAFATIDDFAEGNYLRESSEEYESVCELLKGIEVKKA